MRRVLGVARAGADHRGGRPPRGGLCTIPDPPGGISTLGRALGAVALLLALVACGPRPQQAEGGVTLGELPAGVDRSRLNLLLVTLDTTRVDRIGAYGRPQAAETPAFDRLAREGVLFEQAMTTAPITLPSHSTMFTGQYPPQHGVRDNGGFFLGPEALTLTERLKDRGFRTGAFVGAFVLDSKWGLDQGFETYADDFDLSKVKGVSLGNVQRRSDDVVDLALPWLNGVGNDRFFAWLHFYDAHTPYDPPEPFKSRYARTPYNGEVAHADFQLGRVVDHLRARGLLDRTIIVVVGDHGESLGDHGEGTHGFFIYESATHVPLLIRAPFTGTTSRRVRSLVRTVDLMPTVLDLLGEPKGETPLVGQSVVPLMTGEAEDLGVDGYAEAMYPLHHFGWSALRAFRLGKYKLIDAPRPELFDLEQDPDELHNLYEEQQALGDRLRTALQGMERGFAAARTAPVSASADVDPAVREKLASLGYVSSFVATADDASVPRADPKDKIELFNLMTQARELSEDPEATAQGIALLKRVVAEDPNVIDAWFNLGNAAFKQGKNTDAIDYFKRALALKPDYDVALINLANAYRALGRDAEALAGYEHYLRVDPKNAIVQFQAGEIHMDAGRTEQARTYFEAALAIDPKVAAARVALGVLAFQRGDTATADRELRAALEAKPDVRLAHFNLGSMAEARGDVDSALASYRREYELHADAYKALFNAGRLLQQRGDTAGARTLLEQAVTANREFAEGHLYLSQAHLAAGNTTAAAASARQGIALSPRGSATVALGHFVLAEVAVRAGRMDEAARELERGKAAEQRATAAAPRQ